MSKKIVSTLAGLIVLLAAVSLHARSNQMQVTVPFGFVAGGKTLPAGNYIVELNTDSGTRGVIVLRRDGQQPILLWWPSARSILPCPSTANLSSTVTARYFFWPKSGRKATRLGGLWLPVTAKRRWRTTADQTRRLWRKPATGPKEVLYV